MSFEHMHGRGGGPRVPKGPELPPQTPEEQLREKLHAAELDVATVTTKVKAMGVEKDPSTWDLAKQSADKSIASAEKALTAARAHESAAPDGGERIAAVAAALAEAKDNLATVGERPDGIERVALEDDLMAIQRRAAEGGRDEMSLHEWARHLNDEVKAVVSRLSPEDWDRLRRRVSRPVAADALGAWLKERPAVRGHVEGLASDGKERAKQRARLAEQAARDEAARATDASEPAAESATSESAAADGATAADAASESPAHETGNNAAGAESPTSADASASGDEAARTVAPDGARAEVPPAAGVSLAELVTETDAGEGAAEPGRPDPLPHRAAAEAALGEDFGNVTAYTGRPKAMEQMCARAAAQGETVVFAEGAPSAGTVGHELAHVAQQRKAGGASDGIGGGADVAPENSPAEVEAGTVAARVEAGDATAIGVEAEPAAAIHLDRGHAPPAGADAPPSPKEAALDFLTHLRPRHFHVAPRPLIVTKGGGGMAMVMPIGKSGPPLATGPARLRWKLTDAALQPLGNGEVPWPMLMPMAPPIALSLPAAGSYVVEMEIEIAGAGSREVFVNVEAIAPEIENLAERSDDEIAQHRDDLQARLAVTKDPKTRALLERAYQTAEWEATQRGIPRATDPDEVRAASGWTDAPGSRYPDGAPKWVPEDPVSMRAWIEREIAARGWERGRDEVHARVNSGIVGATFSQQQMAREQLAMVEADMRVFADRFEMETFTTAHKMLTDSTRSIGAVIGSYGLGSGVSVEHAAERYIADEDSLSSEVEAIVGLMKRKDEDDPAGRAGKKENRGDLGAVVAGLVEQQRQLDLLLVQYQTAKQSIWAREHASHHRKPEGARFDDDDLMSPELREQIHGIDRSRQARGDGPLAFPLPAVEYEPPMSAEERATAIMHQLVGAQQGFRASWAQAEAVHPILIAYRGEDGADGHKLHALNSGNDEAMRGILRTIVPKLADIKRARAGIQASRPHPYRLDNVVSLAMQRMLVPPGSIREAVVRQKVADAGDGPVPDWLAAAITLALAAITFVPSGGSSSALVIAADLGGLALDSYMAIKAYDDYAQMKPMANTSLDRAHALASEEPSLTWFAIDLISAGIGAGAVMKGWRQAVQIRRTAEAGDSAQAAIRELNEFGARHGLGDDLGAKIAEGGPYRADPSLGRVASGEAREYAGHLGGLAADHADDLARRLGTGVEVDPKLRHGQIDIDFDDAGGHVWVIGIRVAPDATVADALAHRVALERMRRYNGGLGELRRLMDRAGRALGTTGDLAVGSDKWRAWAEIEKLSEEVFARQRALRGKPAAEIADQLEAEIDLLETQIAHYQTTLDDGGEGARLSENVVSSPPLSKARRDAQQEGVIMPGAFNRADVGAPQVPPGARAPHLDTAIETTVDEATRLGHVHGRDAVGEWVALAKEGEGVEAIRTALAQRARNVADEANVQLRSSYLYRSFANTDPEAAKQVVRSAYHQAAENYFVKLEKAAHEMHGEQLQRAARRGRTAKSKDDLDALEMVMDALGAKPVAGRLTPNGEMAGRFIKAEDLSPELRQVVEQAGLPGVSFTRAGDPDFTPWTYRDGGVVGDVDIGQLTGNRERDFDLADAMAGIRPGERPAGHTWHHHEGARLILVPTGVHDVAKHAGPSALYDAVTGTRSYNRPRGQAKEVPWEPLV